MGGQAQPVSARHPNLFQCICTFGLGMLERSDMVKHSTGWEKCGNPRRVFQGLCSVLHSFWAWFSGALVIGRLRYTNYHQLPTGFCVILMNEGVLTTKLEVAGVE